MSGGLDSHFFSTYLVQRLHSTLHRTRLPRCWRHPDGWANGTAPGFHPAPPGPPAPGPRRGVPGARALPPAPGRRGLAGSQRHRSGAGTVGTRARPGSEAVGFGRPNTKSLRRWKLRGEASRPKAENGGMGQTKRVESGKTPKNASHHPCLVFRRLGSRAWSPLNLQFWTTNHPPKSDLSKILSKQRSLRLVRGFLVGVSCLRCPDTMMGTGFTLEAPGRLLRLRTHRFRTRSMEVYPVEDGDSNAIFLERAGS